MNDIFVNIYERNNWSESNNNCGLGSSVEYNKDTYVPFLKKFIQDKNIKTIVDLGCGDFRCGPIIFDDLDVSYIGYDIYNKLIQYLSKRHSSKYNFFYMDVFQNKESIINGDLCIIKDVLQHWSLINIYVFLDYLVTSNKFKYILITNCCNQTGEIRNLRDIRDGDFRPLNSCFFPLKRYKAVEVYSYHTKQCSLITIEKNEKNENYLKYLEVYAYDNKVRLGVNYDGGYVIADIPNVSYDCYISAGVGDEESFSRDFIKKYNMNEYNCFAIDGSIEKYPYHFTTDISFIKKYIGTDNTPHTTNLLSLVNKYNNIFLKIDIEGGEYSWLLMKENNLDKFGQIVIEFHGINDDGFGTSHIDKIKCFSKLSKTHYLVHAHGNNNGKKTGNIPDIIELTYVNKKLVSPFGAIGNLPLNKTKFPIENIDYPNNMYVEDYTLHTYPFFHI